jgi:hypothetical protein
LRPTLPHKVLDAFPINPQVYRVKMTQTRIRSTVTLLLLSAAPLAAQTAPPRPPSPAVATSAPAAAPGPAALPSAILRPALDSLQQAVAIARPDKWKAASAVIAESANDIQSIQRDLGQTLPPLLSAADASPGSLPQLLPAYRNVEALYDVLVRVTQTSVLAAPAQQSTALQQATMNLQQARRQFGDLLDSAAQSQDRHLHDLQTKLTSLQSAPSPPAPVCPTPAPAKKPKPRPKPAAKPATPAPSTAH